MITKTKTVAAVDRPALATGVSGPWSTPPCTLEEHLRSIESMGQQINGYVQFMCQVASLSSVSGEAKERAAAAFYEQMVVVVRQLGRIHEKFRLE